MIRTAVASLVAALALSPVAAQAYPVLVERGATVVSTDDGDCPEPDPTETNPAVYASDWPFPEGDPLAGTDLEGVDTATTAPEPDALGSIGGEPEPEPTPSP